jgi:glycosyltransferase involved in cell wall biosynthesis
VPDVTVVIPTRNRSRLLLSTLRSALAQRDVDVRIVIVDEASTDDTRDVIARHGDARVRSIRHDRPQGVSVARNHGIAESDTEWVAFLDDDDLWAPDKLALQLGRARAEGRDWTYGASVSLLPTHEVSGGGPPPSPDAVCRDLPLRNVVPGGASNVVARRALLERVGPFDPALRHMSDWDMWIRLASAGPPAIVDAPVVAYRLHAGNASVDTADIAREMSILERRYAGLRRGAPVDRAYVHRWIAWSAARMGRRRDALHAYARAVLAGDVASLGRAAVAVAFPSILTWRMRDTSDSRYAALAWEWLAPQLAP